jgi:hypothetical protein
VSRRPETGRVDLVGHETGEVSISVAGQRDGL